MASLHNVLWALRGRFWLFVKRRGWMRPDYTQADQSLDRMAPFDEFPACDFCGHDQAEERLTANDGSRIVSCRECGLWFTSPRINESVWEDYLRTPTPRSVEFTENRLAYGVALSSNIRFTLPDWKMTRLKGMHALLDDIEAHLGGPVTRLHDVGAGVGLLLEAARERGAAVSGNELNSYACQVMRERLGLDVRNQSLPGLDIEGPPPDVVTMCDYLEHSYHPYKDLLAVRDLLRPGGVLYVNTFHVDCQAFETHGENWNFLFWNHAHHFDVPILERMLASAGFRILEARHDRRNPLVSFFAARL